jgi:excisionase family DNA binding protein
MNKEADTMSDKDERLQIAIQAVQFYADKHPRPTQVTQQQAAEMLGVSRKTIYNYIRAGHLKLNRCGYLPIEDVDAVRAPQ